MDAVYRKLKIELYVDGEPTLILRDYDYSVRTAGQLLARYYPKLLWAVADPDDYAIDADYIFVARVRNSAAEVLFIASLSDMI